MTNKLPATETISDVDDICSLVRDGFTEWTREGHVEVKSKGELLLFNYTHAAQVLGRWNTFERLSRGLIIQKNTGSVVGRSFDKFFNWNETGRTSSARLHSVTEKMDGVLGVLYRLGGRYCVATRGAFDSPQACWATGLLGEKHNLEKLSEEWTLIFEIINPSHRLVVNYGNTSALFLLAARNRFTGTYTHMHRGRLPCKTCCCAGRRSSLSGK